MPVLLGCMAVCMLGTITGCDEIRQFTETPTPAPTVPPLPALQALGDRGESAIVARGKLVPRGGIIKIIAPAGDRLYRLNVKAGDSVKRGQVLGELESIRAHKIELDVAVKQLEEAESRVAAENDAATAKLQVAQLQLSQARLTLQQAKDARDRANQPNGKLSLLSKKAQLAQEQLDRLIRAQKDPTAGRLVSESKVSEQQLAVNEAKTEIDDAKAAAEDKIRSGELAISIAEEELSASKAAIAAANATTGIESSKRKIDLLQLQLETGKLISPIDGTVLVTHLQQGEATVGMPVMELADTNAIMCLAEINVADLPRIEVEMVAAISSPALSENLAGNVHAISPVVGAPRMPSPNPMAQVDYDATEVEIHLSEDSVSRVSTLINLPVDVAIAAVTSKLRKRQPQDMAVESVPAKSAAQSSDAANTGSKDISTAAKEKMLEDAYGEFGATPESRSPRGENQ
ncbi:MAG: HlyD family efflux transporter periplasmic adaptor subunit [Planctomycetota bacterium]